MMCIMQEHGETVCAVGSALRNDCIPSFAAADISMSGIGAFKLAKGALSDRADATLLSLLHLPRPTYESLRWSEGWAEICG